MGYEYELLDIYAKYLGVELEVKIVKDMDNIFDDLNSGKGDVIAANLTITQQRLEEVDFTFPHMLARQVLIQKMPDNWREIPIHKTEEKLVRNPVDLSGKEVYVRKNTSFYTRLLSLEDEIGEDIFIREVSGDVDTEQLIEDVAMGKISYTIADENIAYLNKAYYPNIDIKTAISFPQKIAWAVRKNSPVLLDSMNVWIKKARKTSDYATIFNKYFRSSKAQSKRVKSDFSTINGDKISKYDDLLKSESNLLDWDWRLLAAQVYQESKFDPEAKSWSGAYGLMQLLPETAENFGFEDYESPELNVKIGILFLMRLNQYWSDKIIDDKERIKFVLASYNAGLGHVIDARRLAEKYGRDTNLWEDNVADYLLLKAQKKYYTDSVVRHGYCRGKEPYLYVKNILARYNHYKKLVAANNS